MGTEATAKEAVNRREFSRNGMPKGGPAGSGVLEATISTAPERPGGAGLGNILMRGFTEMGAIEPR